MRVTVQLFARLRETAGESRLSLDVPAGSTVADVWSAVTARYPDLGPFTRAISCAVNEDFARVHRVIEDGDDVAFLPPVSGGSGPCR